MGGGGGGLDARLGQKLSLCKVANCPQVMVVGGLVILGVGSDLLFSPWQQHGYT